MSNSLELSQLYIIGDATPYAWDVQKAGEMQKVDDGVFRWSGHLEAGSLLTRVKATISISR